MQFGLDFLGGAKYPDRVVKCLPADWALGIFAECFGDAFPLVKKIVDRGQTPCVRIHLIWSDTHDYGDKDIPTLIRLCKKYNQLAGKGTAILLSPFCEHNIKFPEKYLKIVADNAPLCIPVNSPAKGSTSKIYENEIHGSAAKFNGYYSYSYDGLACVDSDCEMFKSRHAKSHPFYFWTPQFNGLTKAKYIPPEIKPPRDQRNAWPTKELIESVVALSKPRGDTKLPDKWLWKSHSEQHTVPPAQRELKPVFICPVKAPFFELRNARGKVLLKSEAPQPFVDGRWRYYFSQYGYQISSEPLLLMSGDEVYGKVNPGFRSGEFRNKE